MTLPAPDLTPDQQAAGVVVEQWTAVGVRLDRAHARCAAFIEPPEPGQEPELHLIGGKIGRAALIIGGHYWVKVERSPKGVTVWGEPAWTGGRADGEAAQQWRAREVTALAELETRARARKAHGDDPLDALIRPLQELAVATCRTRSQRDAFTAHVLGSIWWAWHNPEGFKP